MHDLYRDPKLIVEVLNFGIYVGRRYYKFTLKTLSCFWKKAC